MEIMKEAKWSREGNDCWLTDYCCIIRVDSNLYIVLHVDKVEGSWTGNPISSNSTEYKNYDDALEVFKSIGNKWRGSE